MTVIQWFPGHMKKTLVQIQNNLKLVDGVLMILDSRIPFSSINWDFIKKIHNKPLLLLCNKITLADKAKMELFYHFFRKKNLHFMAIDSKNQINIRQIYPKIKTILPKHLNNIRTFYNLMIVGVPNVGKSTLINCLARKKVVLTANKPGITKKLQWISLPENIRLLDTPGVLMPKFSSSAIGYSLSICGCIKETILHKEEILHYILDYLKKHYYEKLKNFFQFTDTELIQKNLLAILLTKNKNITLAENQKIIAIFNQIMNKMTQINFDLELIS